MKIFMNELENVCNAMLNHAGMAGLTKVYISEDGYWEVMTEDAFQPIKKFELGYGSLFDDWEWLEKVLSGKNQMIFLDFDRIGNIITAIGNELFEKPPHQVADNDLLVKISDIKRLFKFIFTGAKTERQNLTKELLFDELDIPFNEYWRVDLECIYADAPPTDKQINLQSFPKNLPTLTKYFQSGMPVGLKDFEQIGVLFRAISLMPQNILYTMIDIAKDKV